MEQPLNESTLRRRPAPRGMRRAAATPAYYLQRPAGVWLAALDGRSPSMAPSH